MNEQLYLMALGLSYDEKFEKSILTIQEYEKAALQADPDGYYVCDSYGKDSTVLVHLFQLAGVKFKAHHSLTTIDPPELIHFGRKHHPDTVVHRPKIPLLQRLVNRPNGPPTRLARWCCEEYKESSGGKAVKVIGVRAEESPRRALNWRVLTKHRKEETLILCPILYWTKDDIWRHIRKFSLPYCKLYDPPFNRKRIGCVGCPMAGDGRKEQFTLWPGYEKVWKVAFKKFWEKWHGVPTEKPHWNPLPTNCSGFSLKPDEYIEARVWTVAENDDYTIGEVVTGFWNSRRWFDMPRPDGGYFHTWEDMWTWWMEDGINAEEEDSCQGVLF